MIPGVGRRRRPFLAPLWLLFALALMALGIAILAWRTQATDTVIVLRHAEKVLGTIEDPPLTPEGERRALRLAEMLGSKDAPVTPVSAIYVSDTRRSQQTAVPLAQALGLKPVIYGARDVASLLDQIKTHQRGRACVVIAHSDTVPDIVARLSRGKVRVAMRADEFDSIYVVTVPSYAPVSVLRLRY
jgi:phosphohistidine phosphatase SixA